MWIRILGEGSHLHRCRICVVAHNQLNQKSVCNAMGQVMICTQFMCHRMADTQECICKCHTSHGGSVRHLLSCDRICSTLVISAGQIGEDILGSHQCKAVCIVCCHDGCISLQCMGQCIDTGSTGQTLGLIHHEISVYDRHVRQQLIVSDGPLGTCISVRDNCERSYLGTGTGRSRDCNEHCLLAHLREYIDSLTNIHEVHSQIFEVALLMLIHEPHDLAGIHGRTATQSDDDIRSECLQLLKTFPCYLKRRVRSHLIEAGMGDTHIVQLIRNRFCHTAGVKERIRNDEGFLLSIVCFQLVQRNRQTAFLKVNLLRCTEPKHILSPFSNGLDTDQMFHIYVL